MRGLFRWYLVEVSTIVFILLMLTEGGLGRLMWAGLVLMGLVILTFKHGGEAHGARLLRALLAFAALGLAMLGVGFAGAGVFLLVQGSVGLLAGMVLIPAGLGIVVGGWAAFRMARTKQVRWSETLAARLEREGFSSLRGPIDPPSPVRTEVERG